MLKPKDGEPIAFFGPVTEGEAETLREHLMCDDFWALRVGDSLSRFLTHELTPREFAYEVQVLAESCYQRLWGSEREVECLDGERGL